MKVHIKYFASIREALACGRIIAARRVQEVADVLL